MTSLATSVLTLAVSDPAPATWGPTKQWGSWVNMTDPGCFNKTGHLAQTIEWTFRYSFDAVIGADRYDHPKGARDQLCFVDIVPLGEACTVLSTASDDVSHIIYNDKCCQFPVKFGPTRFDWIEHDHGTYQGQQAENGVDSDVWLALGQNANKNWLAQSVDPKYPKLPTKYWEYCTPADKPVLKHWDFHLDTFDVKPQDPSLFVVPDGCDATCIWPKNN
jgi:hypothetical protein